MSSMPFKLEIVKDIANEDAAIYGGSCYAIRWNDETQEYIADCIENGEYFWMKYSKKDIEERIQ